MGVGGGGGSVGGLHEITIDYVCKVLIQLYIYSTGNLDVNHSRQRKI